MSEIIDEIRKEKIEEMLKTGKRWMITRQGVPMFQVTTDEVVDTIWYLMEKAPEIIGEIRVFDLIESKEYTTAMFLEKHKVEEKERFVKEVSFIEDTEAKGKQRFWFNSEADAEICAVVMGQVMTGEYRFTSPVNYEEKGMFRVRGVLRPVREKWGTPQLMNAKDYENAWTLQQFFSWILEGTLRIVSVDWKKEAWIVVEWEKAELPVPEREWKMYKVEEKRINGRSWRITGVKK